MADAIRILASVDLGITIEGSLMSEGWIDSALTEPRRARENGGREEAEDTPKVNPPFRGKLLATGGRLPGSWVFL